MSYLHVVTVSFVLRLDNDRLQAGQIVGQAEHVVSGERSAVSDVAELVEFLRRSTSPVEPDD